MMKYSCILSSRKLSLPHAPYCLPKQTLFAIVVFLEQHELLDVMMIIW